MVWDMSDPTQVAVTIGGGVRPELTSSVTAPAPVQNVPDALCEMLGRWVAAAEQGGDNPTPFSEVRQSIHVIYDCYEKRERLTMPWQAFEED